MWVRELNSRAVLRRVFLFAAVASAVMLVASSWMYFRSTDPAGAATRTGSLDVSPSSGTSADDYTLSFPNGVGTACPGDSATGGFFLSGFVVPTGTAIDGLQFNSLGPNVGFPVQDSGGTAVVNQTLEVNTGNVTQLPGAYSFANNSPGDFPTGDYEVGLACTQGTGAGMVKSYWTTTMTISQNAAGGPAQISWAVSTTTTTTTTSSTSTSSSSTTSTTTDGSTTTTVGGTTTTTGGAEVSGADIFGGTPSAASPVTTAGQLPYTGSSPLPMVFWAVCLLVFGRMVMLLGKRTKVIGDDSP
jgi:hypothetical protein